MATLAVFIALGGGAYAASKLPNNSVGTAQIKNQAVTPLKISASAIALFKGQQGANGVVGARGAEGQQGAQGAQGTQGLQGTPGSNATIDGFAAGGDLSGTYPNPSIAAGAITRTNVRAPTFQFDEIWNSAGGWGVRSVGLGYFVDLQGVCHLRGFGGGGTSGTVAFTLPSTCRPVFTTEEVITASSAGAAPGTGAVVIQANGSVTPFSATGDVSQEFGVDGVTFPTTA
jgi:hypothetical protein